MWTNCDDSQHAVHPLHATFEAASPRKATRISRNHSENAPAGRSLRSLPSPLVMESSDDGRCYGRGTTRQREDAPTRKRAVLRPPAPRVRESAKDYACWFLQIVGSGDECAHRLVARTSLPV